MIIKVIFLLVIAIASAACTADAGDTNYHTNANEAVNATSPVADSGAAAAGGGVPAESPNQLIAELYKAHDAQKGPFFERTRAVIDKYFAKTLADLIWKDEQRPPDQISAMGADPLYDGQDFEIKNFAVGEAKIDGDKATVPVTFQNFGQNARLTYDMVRAENGWRIADIRYPSKTSLLAIYRENAKFKSNPEGPASPDGEFEGRYRVGETFCTVTPVQVGFQVRWDKGSGFETFVFEGRDERGHNFVAEADGGYNIFTFLDESYNAGVFTRADGRTFKVSRAR